MDPTQLSFSVASLLGEKLVMKSKRKDEQNAGSRHVLPPTPQPSDSEEDEPRGRPRKRRCVEHCELAKVNKNQIIFISGQLSLLSKRLPPSLFSHFPSISLCKLNRLEQRTRTRKTYRNTPPSAHFICSIPFFNSSSTRNFLYN